jgi:hypothetical protein
MPILTLTCDPSEIPDMFILYMTRSNNVSDDIEHVKIISRGALTESFLKIAHILPLLNMNCLKLNKNCGKVEPMFWAQNPAPF